MNDIDGLAWDAVARGDSIWEELTSFFAASPISNEQSIALASAVVLNLVIEAAQAVAKEDDVLFSNFAQSVKAALELGRRHGELDD